MTHFFQTFFSYGFRSFFLGAGVYAIFSVIAWLSFYAGALTDKPQLDAYLWHAHEMIFGYTMAVVAGFLLTAAPKWTNDKHAQSVTIAALFLLWCAGRVVMWFSDVLPQYIVLTVDAIFIPLLALSLAGILIRARKMKNILFLVLLILIFLCNVLTHLTDTWAHVALYVATFLILMMVVIIGGRIIPMFTRNGILTNTGVKVELKPQSVVNLLSIISVPVFLLSFIVFGLENLVTALLAMFSAFINAVRMLKWHSLKTWNIPILWILHVGYLWFVVGMLLLAFAGQGIVFTQVDALHALTLGCIGTMTFGMMTRVALGHTGRDLKVKTPIVFAYVFLQISVILRVFGYAIFNDLEIKYVSISGWLWVVSFVLFLWTYTPILLSRTK